MKSGSADGGADQTEVHMRGKEQSCVNEQERADSGVVHMANLLSKFDGSLNAQMPGISVFLFSWVVFLL